MQLVTGNHLSDTNDNDTKVNDININATTNNFKGNKTSVAGALVVVVAIIYPYVSS